MDICFMSALHVGTELGPHTEHPPVPTIKGEDPCDLERGDKELRASKNQRHLNMSQRPRILGSSWSKPHTWQPNLGTAIC